MLGSNRGAMN